MASNGERRACAKNPPGIPTIGEAMHQGSNRDSAKMPSVPEAMRQGTGRKGGGPIPSVQAAMRQGGKTVK